MLTDLYLYFVFLHAIEQQLQRTYSASLFQPLVLHILVLVLWCLDGANSRVQMARKLVVKWYE